MTPTEAREHMLTAAGTVSSAATILKLIEPTMRAFLKEQRDLDNFGWAVDPTLYKNAERRAVAAVIAPIFEAALEFLTKYDAQMATAKNALAKVTEKP